MKKILILMLLLIAVTTMFGQVNLNNNQLKLEADGDADFTGNYLLDSQSITNLASKGAGYWFDGSSGDVSIGSDTKIDNIFDGGGSISFNCIITSDGESDIGRLLYTTDWSLRTQEQSGDFVKLRFYQNLDSNVGVWESAVSIPINTELNIILTYSNVYTADPILYVNGKAITLTETAIPSGTRISDVGDVKYIGNNDADSNTFDGSISDVKLFNTALTATEVKDLYSGKELPYKYVGASQTDLLSGWNFTVGWSVNTGCTISDNNTIAISSGTAGTFKNLGLEIGKKYRLKINITSPASTFEGVYNTFGANSNLIGSNLIDTYEFTAITESVYFRFTGAGTIDFITLEITQIGNVANYSSDGVGHNQWLDNSGNELNGEVSGAVPINLTSDDEQTLTILDITGETTKTNWLPAGYAIESILFENETTATITNLDIGFSDAGGEIVAAANVTDDAQGSMTVLQRVADIDADDTFYISADNWNSCTVNLYVNIKRFRTID